MDAKIIGNVMPVLEVTPNRGEPLIAVSGDLSWMTESIQLRTSTRTAGATGTGRSAFAAKLPPLAGGRLQRLADRGLPAPLFDQCRLLSAGSSYISGNPRLGGFGPRGRAR